MALQLDPEIQAALVPLMAVMDGMPKLPAGDVEGRRTAFAGVLGAMFRIFGEEGVSVSGAIQKESDGTAAEFVVTTHPAPDAALQRIRSRVVELDVVQAVESFLRVL